MSRSARTACIGTASNTTRRRLRRGVLYAFRGTAPDLPTHRFRLFGLDPRAPLPARVPGSRHGCRLRFRPDESLMQEGVEVTLASAIIVRTHFPRGRSAMKLHSMLRRVLMTRGVWHRRHDAAARDGRVRHTSQRLAFDVDEGLNLNSFLRDGPVAAHLLLRSGSDPRLLVAFPAGNSGVGLWFAHTAAPVAWTLLGRPQPHIAKDAQGRPLYGMTAEARLTGAQTCLSSRRFYPACGFCGTIRRSALFQPKSPSSDDSKFNHHLGARPPRRAAGLSASALRSLMGRSKPITLRPPATAGSGSRSPR